MRVDLELQPCLGNRSGIGTYAYELVRHLRSDDGMAFHGTLFNFLGRRDCSAALKGIALPVHENRLFSYGFYRRIWSFLPLPYRHMFPGTADLSVFFDYIVPPGVQGKVITTIHDMTFLRYPETMKGSNIRRIKDGLSYSIERSSRIITVSAFSKREISELLHIPEERISVVYNAPSVSAGAGDFSSLKKKYRITPPYLLYLGTIEPRKNLVRLIHAYELLKQEYGIPHQLVLAGGDGWLCNDIHRAANDSSYRDSIVFTGYISADDKNTLYQKAEAFVFPSLYEGFGIPPLEAMHHGCPVVASRAASLPEILGNAAVLVDALSDEKLAEGIWRILSDDAFRSEQIYLGRLQAHKYSWQNSARTFIDICKEVLNRE